MARKAIVTRTVSGMEATVLGMNLETATPETKTFTLSSTYTKEERDEEGKIISSEVDEKKMLKDVKKLYDTETFTIVKITSYNRIDRLYGMWEEDFIAHAMELDPKTRKPIQ